MEPVFFVMAILGCGDGQAACTEAQVDPVHYATAAQCQAALPNMLARYTDLDFPVVAARCRASGPIIAATARATTKG